ncbi:uroporphyrinogen-III synthase [Acinetobacter sp. ANC 4470]|uniref:uroporphyrinogen-III synthase n=1 Tax=Acinetobacter sp. ANC 4470 TaxID=1977881 RepID=UPI000A35A867|nr:uroporphyrinogen-III synthase [Acinetobacter sp. ANC 4470]OTG69401.1 uroporphyrinogen-III synthase [Acinetobacter sp. ANC 4470]
MLFINTRPQTRAENLSHALRMAQVEVLDLPLLELVARPWSNTLSELYQRLPSTQLIVVVSPTAVEIGMDYLTKASLSLEAIQHIQWIAVGEATAQALALYGIVAKVPLVETSEGMLQLPILQALSAGTCIAFWRGEGGRLFMMDRLQQQGIDVLNFILYQRRCPVLTEQKIPHLLAKLAQEKQYYMVVSSEASWINWIDLVRAGDEVVAKGHYLVLGERLYQVVSDYKKNHQACFNITRLSDLKTDSILQQIAVV